MGFLRDLFGKKQPAAAPASAEITVGVNNPFTTEVRAGAGIIVFKCPACQNTVGVTLEQIDPLLGVSVVCPSCKNVNHVPGAYKTELNPPGCKITGSVRVPIARYADWYYGHPYVKSLIHSRQSDLLWDHGLWAFCGACHHQFPATVLWNLASAQRTRGAAFTAQTPDAARDTNALVAGHCSHCRHKELLIVVAEIPDYVRSAIASSKQ